MYPKRIKFFAFLTLILSSLTTLLYLQFSVAASSAPVAKAESNAVQTGMRDAFLKLPMSFEANRGQTDRKIKFFARGSGYSLFLTPDEAVLSLRRRASGNGKGEATLKADASGSTLRMKLAGANRAPRVSGVDELPGKSNYFIGRDPRKWRTGVPSFAKVQYRQVYPGVDLIYYGNQRQLEYDFIVAPGADPKLIGMKFSGTNVPKIDDAGALRLSSPGGDVVLQKPLVYQEIAGQRKTIDSRYVLDAAQVVRFALGSYDHDHALIIDPVLIYSSFLGSGTDDGVYELASDASGNAFVTGYTTGIGFPTTPGAYDSTYSGGPSDAFVTKLNSTGTAAIFSTYLGGSDSEQGDGIAVDAAGNVYVGGGTKSINFPTTAGAYDTACPECASGLSGNVPGDAFIAKFDPTGVLLKSTLYGAGDYEAANSLALDSVGNVYIGGGWAGGFCNCLPLAGGGFQGKLSYYDSFLAKFDSDLSTLLYARVIGGNNDDYSVQGIAPNSPNVVSITGITRSTDFPTTPGAFDSVCGTSPVQHNGIFDAFVMTIDTSSGAVPFSTCLGGSGDEGGSGIAVDSTGMIWVTGGTPSADFPVTPGAYDTTPNGLGDVFVTKLNPSASGAAQLAYSTFIGGSDNDGGAKVALDASGNVYVAGSTSSANFPTVNPLQGYGGGQDAFISQLNPTTNLLVYSTYLGSCLSDAGLALALDPAGNAYVGGLTSSASFPVTAGAFQTGYGGGGDGFVMKLGPGAGVPYTACPAASPTPISTPPPDFDGDGVPDASDNCPNTPNSNQTDTDGDGIGDACDTNAPPPTLNGEVAAFPPPPGSVVVTQTGATPCTTYSFSVTTTASGPYQGTFTATGTFTLEPMTPNPITPNITHRVVEWTESFTINQPVSLLPPQPVAHVITGTKRLNPAANSDGINVAQCSPTLVNPSPIATTYQATITGADGTFTDSGSAQSGIVHLPFDSSAASFFENFTSSQTTTTPNGDADGDGVPDANDNCPTVSNADQADADGDGRGNACDACPNDSVNDADGDGVCGNVDNCPATANPNQADFDGDRIGDACDPNLNDGPTGDLDGDGVRNNADNCPSTPNSDQLDTDNDHIGNACDTDDDGDGVLDGADNCPLNANANQADNDRDQIGDVCDADDDNDFVVDVFDNCPLVANPTQQDTDGDRIGDACDPDDDGDGVADGSDQCPGTPAGTRVNAAGCPDADGDGVADARDNCPTVPNPNQADFDRDGIGDACDPRTGPPKDKDQCKNDGWRRFDFPRRFNNQGDCIQFVNTGK